MKQKINLKRISGMAAFMRKHARSKCVFTPCAPLLRAGFCILLVCVGVTAVRSQVPNGTVLPRVCIETTPQTGTVTLTSAVAAGAHAIPISAPIEGTVRLVLNPGGATQEQFIARTPSGGPMVLWNVGSDPTGTTRQLAFAHSAGETIQWSADAEAFLGYNNTSSATVNISRGIISGNFFAPATVIYPSQPSSFLPGSHESFSLKLVSGPGYSWFLNNSTVTFGANNAGQGCATITYQGRLSEQGAAANGQYDLRFRAYEALTGGTAQSGFVTVENAQVTNGIFTVPLNFRSSFTNNFNARFLEIEVRAGAATDGDAFTLLAPRQPITSVPFAINAQTADAAATAIEAANAAKLGGLDPSQYFKTSGGVINGTLQANGDLGTTNNLIVLGNGTISGSLTVNGTINGTVSNAANAINTQQLGGIAANQYLTTTGNGAGLTGIFNIFSLTKIISGAIPPNTSGYSFIGETLTVTLTANQRITGSASMPLATSSGTTVVSVGLCYKIGDGAITNFAGSHSTNTIVDSTFKIYAASATVQPGAGLVQAGMCLGNFNQPLTNNSVNGWAIVTNN